MKKLLFTFLLLLWWLMTSSTFGLYLTSGNVVSVGAGACDTGDTNCNLSSKSITGIATDTFINHHNLTGYLNLNSNQLTSIESGDFAGLSSLTTLYLNYNCNTNGTETITSTTPSRSATIDKANCIPINTTDVTDFINQLTTQLTTQGLYPYILNNPYYIGGYIGAMSFNNPNANNQVLAPVIMQSYYYEGNNRRDWILDATPVEIQYESGTHITYSWGIPFTGVLHRPYLFSTWAIVPGMTGVLALTRFGDRIQRIEFDQPITIRMPARSATSWSTVKIYSSDKESIFDGTSPDRTFEKNGTVIDIMKPSCSNPDGLLNEDQCIKKWYSSCSNMCESWYGWIWDPETAMPYVEFTGTHASRYALGDLTSQSTPDLNSYFDDCNLQINPLCSRLNVSFNTFDYGNNRKSRITLGQTYNITINAKNTSASPSNKIPLPWGHILHLDTPIAPNDTATANVKIKYFVK